MCGYEAYCKVMDVCVCVYIGIRVNTPGARSDSAELAERKNVRVDMPD